MIKNWKLFNESIRFEESHLLKEFIKKYSLKEEEIEPFLLDLSDEHDIQSHLTDTILRKSEENMAQLVTCIIFKKDYKNPKSLDLYVKQLNDQKEIIESIKKSCQRIEISTDYKIIKSDIRHIPFIGAGQNLKESDELIISFDFERTIVSDELSKLRKEFYKTPSEEKKAYDMVIQKLIEGGIPEIDVERLVDTHPDHEDMDYILFAFITDDELSIIADYNKTTKRLIFDRGQLERSIRSYFNGGCDLLLSR